MSSTTFCLSPTDGGEDLHLGALRDLAHESGCRDDSIDCKGEARPDAVVLDDELLDARVDRVEVVHHLPQGLSLNLDAVLAVRDVAHERRDEDKRHAMPFSAIRSVAVR